MRQLGLPLEDMPPTTLPEKMRQAEDKLDNLRYLATRSSTSPAEAPPLVDQRRFNVPPHGNPDLFEKAS